MYNGLIVAFVVVVWAAYFVPLVLRRYDEATKSTALDSLSPLSRVIGRRAAEREAEAEVVEPAPVASSGTAKVALLERAARKTAEAPAPKPVERRAARIAAQRRRRTLITLLSLTAVVGILSFVVLPVWAVAIPLVLDVAWLVACRVQVRHERGISGRSRGAIIPRQTEKVTVKTVDDEETIVVSGQLEDVDPGRKHVMENVPLEADALEEKLEIAVPSVAHTGQVTWDPLPVTLPTYVTKPRAGRTVRTIDFTQPGTWTSGHVEGEEVELPSKAAEPAQGEERKAVGH